MAASLVLVAIIAFEEKDAGDELLMDNYSIEKDAGKELLSNDTTLKNSGVIVDTTQKSAKQDTLLDIEKGIIIINFQRVQMFIYFPG